MSRKRTYNFVSDAKINELKTVQMKKRSENKMNWGVKAFMDWREERLLNFNYDVAIYYSDLNDLANLTLENFRHSLCYFIPEVTKVKGGGLYPGRTLYQLVVAIQKYLNINNVPWKLIEGPEFEEVKTVLDNVMKERTSLNIGVKKKQAQFIPHQTEQLLWEKGVLGGDTPDRLRDTVLFLIGTHCLLRASDEHYQLRRPTPFEPSQLTFEMSASGVKCLVYREDTVSKTHDGGLKDMRSERKEVWVFPNKESEKCCVKLVEKYLKLCPPYQKRTNFYLHSLARPTPNQWYSEQVIGQNTLAKTVKRLLSEANIDGYFTNHSCRRSGTTRLFQAGVDRKLIKDATGHRSDALDCYAVTSEEQRQHMSRVIDQKQVSPQVENVPICEPKNKTQGRGDTIVMKQCSCGGLPDVSTKNLGLVIDNIMSKVDQKGVVKIKMEIEITKE